MPFMPWTPELETGVDFIDSDHRILVDQINILAASLEEDGGGADVVGSVLNVLADYTKRHFAREAEAFEAAGYPESPAHKRQHDLFVARINNEIVAFQEGRLKAAALLDLLKTWLGAHILKEDKRMAAHLRAGHSAMPGSVVAPQKLEGANILIVDDEFNFRNLLKTVMRALGIRHMQEAKDGAEALELTQTTRFDAILLDDRMPLLDGLEFARMVRAGDGPCAQSVMILVPGSNVTVPLIRQALDNGVHDVVKKPISTEAIKSRLERHLLNPLPFQRRNGLWIPQRPKPPAVTSAPASGLPPRPKVITG
ncbi:bacteriohemerythrin [Telmatospirillum sp. J64-1]|uniref:bacteriohemerythrin n=1 Tax=Telmatospirillum sp. J64-1 TaxID=2502183 RepID=UPI00115CB648|nr:bacteriohemerythrin [Telmatospirillum sp. J64-1]